MHLTVTVRRSNVLCEGKRINRRTKVQDNLIMSLPSQLTTRRSPSKNSCNHFTGWYGSCCQCRWNTQSAPKTAAVLISQCNILKSLSFQPCKPAGFFPKMSIFFYFQVQAFLARRPCRLVFRILPRYAIVRFSRLLIETCYLKIDKL